MKYLKSYNESISKDIIEYLKDIVIELQDMGFTIRVGCEDLRYSMFNCKKHQYDPISKNIFSDHCNKDLQLEISKESDKWMYAGSTEGGGYYRYFYYEDVEEVVERINDYMKQEGYNITIRKNDFGRNTQLLSKVEIKFIKNEAS